jgi:hypothetical protein
MITEDDEFERIEREQKIRADWAPKGPPKKPWSQQTIEERINTAIIFWQKSLANVDHDGTALTHDTYNKDPVRYNMAETYSSFLQTLHAIKGGRP